MPPLALLKDTVLLPKTALAMRANLKEAEPARIKKWAAIDLEGKLRAKGKGRKKFVLHDGPPYANGATHVGHAVNKILKDIVVRMKTMAGLDAPYVPGFDCHGLPIEQAALKAMNLANDAATDPLQLRKLSKEHAMKWIGVQTEEFKRMLVGGLWDKPYRTLDPSYEAGQLEALLKIVERGLVYRALRPVYWDPVFRTALAEAEIEYETRTDPSIYVSMPLVNPAAAEGLELPGGTAMVVWTTTPWTMPGNVAVCLGPGLTYALLLAGEKYYIVAADLAESFAKDAGLGAISIVRTFPAAPLVGLECKHPILNRTSRIVTGPHVTLDAGTGCVHTAPGHGREDFDVAREFKLDIAQPLDDAGRYIPNYFPAEQLTDAMRSLDGVAVLNKEYKETANYKVVELLKANGVLIHVGKISHEYPHSWRSKQPIVFRATEQWFMGVDQDGVRRRCMRAIHEEVTWIPEWGLDRIVGMMATRPDWCLSRQRAWGVPIPAFKSKTTGETFLDPAVIKHVIPMFAKEGSDAWWARSVSELLPANYRGPKGETADQLEKTFDVLDVWFDSGASWNSVVEQREELKSDEHRADLYLEGSDQHRGWFQTSLLCSVAARNHAPFKSVLTHGFVLDKDGKAMSKSLGNVIAPQSIIDQFGADILRLWVASEDYRGDMKASMDRYTQLSESYRRLRNTLRFLCGNLDGYDPVKDEVADKDMPELERYVLGRLDEVIGTVRKAYDDYEFHRVAAELTTYCSVDLGAFYLDVLKDRLYCDPANSLRRRAARTALYRIAKALVTLLAPIIPHTADEVWELLPGTDGVPSVHLAEFPTAKKVNEVNNGRWANLIAVRDVVNIGLERARKKKDEPANEEKFIGNPLDARVVLHLGHANLAELANYGAENLAELFLVSEVALSPTPLSSPRLITSEAWPGLQVVIEAAPVERCERCWRHVPTPATYTDEKGTQPICHRCDEAVKSMNA